MNILTKHPLHLIVVLPSFHKESTLKRLLCLLAWEKWIRALALDLTVYSPDPQAELDQIQRRLHIEGSFKSDPDMETARILQAGHHKPVFGQHAFVVHPSLFLYDAGQSVCTCRQIRTKTMEKMIRKALQIQSKWLCRHLHELVDSSLDNWV